MNDELLLLRSLLHSVKIRCWARCSHNHRLVLFSKNDFALGRLSLHVHVLSLHEILFLVDVSSLNFVIERRWSVLAWNTGQRLSLVSINSSLSVGLTETECLRDLASSSCWVRHDTAQYYFGSLWWLKIEQALFYSLFWMKERVPLELCIFWLAKRLETATDSWSSDASWQTMSSLSLRSHDQIFCKP